MIRKIITKYWVIFVLVLLTPILFNLISIQQKYGLHRYYTVCNMQYDLWLDLSGQVLVIDIVILALSFLVLFISLRTDSHQRTRVRTYLLLVFLVLLTSGISGFGNLLIDIQWNSIYPDCPFSHRMSEYANTNLFLSATLTASLLVISIWKGRRSLYDAVSATE
jgi:hypothetical protein